MSEGYTSPAQDDFLCLRRGSDLLRSKHRLWGSGASYTKPTKPFTLAVILIVSLVVALMAIVTVTLQVALTSIDTFQKNHSLEPKIFAGFAFGKFGVQGLRFRAWVLVAGFGV